MADTNALPIKPVEIGGYKFWNVNGRLWPCISGGATEGGDGGGDGKGGDGKPSGSGDGKGGDGDPGPGDGDDADKDWKSRSRQNENRAKKAERDLVAAQKRIDDIEAAGKNESQKAIDAARKEAADTVRGELAAEIFQERIDGALLATASGRFADPSDAVNALRTSIVIGDNGRPDPDDIKSAVDDLLKRKPYLAAEHLNTGDGDGGMRGGPKPDPDVSPGLGRMRAAYETQATKKK